MVAKGDLAFMRFARDRYTSKRGHAFCLNTVRTNLKAPSGSGEKTRKFENFEVLALNEGVVDILHFSSC